MAEYLILNILEYLQLIHDNILHTFLIPCLVPNFVGKCLKCITEYWKSFTQVQFRHNLFNCLGYSKACTLPSAHTNIHKKNIEIILIRINGFVLRKLDFQKCVHQTYVKEKARKLALEYRYQAGWVKKEPGISNVTRRYDGLVCL